MGNSTQSSFGIVQTCCLKLKCHLLFRHLPEPVKEQVRFFIQQNSRCCRVLFSYQSIRLLHRSSAVTGGCQLLGDYGLGCTNLACAIAGRCRNRLLREYGHDQHSGGRSQLNDATAGCEPVREL
jgi:hypothetical protein